MAHRPSNRTNVADDAAIRGLLGARPGAVPKTTSSKTATAPAHKENAHKNVTKVKTGFSELVKGSQTAGSLGSRAWAQPPPVLELQKPHRMPIRRHDVMTIAAEEADEAAKREEAAIAKLVAKQQGGCFEAADPNNPLADADADRKAAAVAEQARKQAALSTPRGSAYLSSLQTARMTLAKPKPVSAPTPSPRVPAPPVSVAAAAECAQALHASGKAQAAASKTATPAAAEAEILLVGSSGKTAKTKDRSSEAKKGAALRRQLEAQYGKRIAMQLMEADPAKDAIREKKSRFQYAVEEEHRGKRNAMLAELEAQDSAQAKMEAMMSVNIMAWKCKQCHCHTDSDKSKAVCEHQGHTLTQVKVERTRWECRGCQWSLSVLNKEIPTHCHRCNGVCWHQVSLNHGRFKTAPMEKDMFLPRGDEMKFINSIPSSMLHGAKKFKGASVKEASDEYAGYTKNLFE